MPVIVQFRNGKFGVRGEGGGMFKSPYLFLRNDTYGWCDPLVALPREYEFENRAAAESSAFMLANVQNPDFGVPVDSSPEISMLQQAPASPYAQMNGEIAQHLWLEKGGFR